MKFLPEEALCSCTVNAAHSLGLLNEIGSIEPGKHADLVIWNTQNIRQVVYHFCVNHIRAVIKAGMVVFKA